MEKKVKGSFLGDYVKMIKKAKDVDWSKSLGPEDQIYLKEPIEDNQWYPFEAYEKLGLAVLSEIGDGDVIQARAWGQSFMEDVCDVHESLVCEEEPSESIVRFQVYRGNFYNFDPITILMFSNNYAKLKINYGMNSTLAEQAATYQTLGYFERLLELSGAAYVKHRFPAMAWEDDPDTILELIWSEVSTESKVKGIIFVDFVRLIKSAKDVDWSKSLTPVDMVYLDETIDLDEYYPLETVERMVVAILKNIAGGDFEKTREWGRASMDYFSTLHPSLIAEDDPGESLMRFQVLRRSYFTFETINISYLGEGYAKISISYRMRNKAEKAATYQTLGFFEQLLELSGVTNLRHQFLSKSWEGDSSTVLELDWREKKE